MHKALIHRTRRTREVAAGAEDNSIRRTPCATFRLLARAVGGFDLDVCATPQTALCRRFYSPLDNGLAQPWIGRAFMNPPYGEQIGQWVRKARDEAAAGAVVVGLLPARTGSAWWRKFVLQEGRPQLDLVSLAFDVAAGTMGYRWRGLVVAVHTFHQRLEFQGANGQLQGESAPFDSAAVLWAHEWFRFRCHGPFEVIQRLRR